LAFAPTCWLTVPFENARRAYYADKTWPLELRRNYTSATNALFRIPFEEGPSYLLKGGFPIAANQFAFWTIYVNFYIFLKNKFFLFWVYNDIKYEWCKLVFQSMAFGIASVIAYPVYQTREMVDLWPKERGGFCTWNNSYRQCFKWMVENMEIQGYNYMRGYSGWLKRYGAQYFVALWMADTLGMMSNCNEAYNSLETIFPIFAEAI
jgi:solute carrier family 25 oxoglutarate transporter 11